jgi:mannose-6-phosphate isomerase
MTSEALKKSIIDGTIADNMQHLAVKSGDSIFIQPGTIHALGPGLLLYEVQQTSDITYRVYDWNRPVTPQRQLHIEKSLEVADSKITGKIIPAPSLGDGERKTVITCPYFTLELLVSRGREFLLDTEQASFHALTVIEGSVRVNGDGWEMLLRRFDTVLVPAVCGAYRIHPLESCRLLRAFVE